MSRIIILGAGNFGRELFSWLEDDVGYRGDSELVFADDTSDPLARHGCLQVHLIGPIDSLVYSPSDRVLMGMTEPGGKRRVHERLARRSIRLATFVHRTATVAARSDLGEGAVVCPMAVVGPFVRLGSAVTVNLAATIGHDAQIGSYSSLMSHVDVTGWCVIGEEVFLGSHATMVPGRVIEDRATIGAGSVVVRRVEAGTTVFGVPARRLTGDNSALEA